MTLDPSYLRGLGPACRASAEPEIKAFVTADGVELHVALFLDAPEPGSLTAFTCGLSDLTPAPRRFELVLVMRSADRAWGEWLGRLACLPETRRLRPRAISGAPATVGDVTPSGFMAAPSHVPEIREARLWRVFGDRPEEPIRFLELYPLFAPDEVELARRVGARRLLRAAWKLDPWALFDPRRRSLASRDLPLEEDPEDI